MCPYDVNTCKTSTSAALATMFFCAVFGREVRDLNIVKDEEEGGLCSMPGVAAALPVCPSSCLSHWISVSSLAAVSKASPATRLAGP